MTTPSNSNPAVQAEMERLAVDLGNILTSLEDFSQRLAYVAEVLEAPAPTWTFPIGQPGFPVSGWYVSSRHCLDGSCNRGYKHTGIDINWEAGGDSDRGCYVFAISAGTVHSVGYAGGKSWLGSIVIQHQWQGAPLWVRYAHLEDVSAWSVGDAVITGQRLGVIGDYKGGDGGDHLHLDMARTPFAWNWWLTPSVEWLDPLTVFNDVLDRKLVSEMVSRDWLWRQP